ncbi:MAG: RDD family protein [Actinomycetota bacterium]
MTHASAPGAGWYRDPNDPSAERYFDGFQWTHHVRAMAGGFAPNPVAGGFAASPVAARSTPTPTGPMMRLVGLLLEYVLVLITLGVGWLIWAMFTVGKGQTPAKRVLGQRVISIKNQRPAGFARMFWLRGLLCNGILVPFVASITLGILLLMPFWNKQNRNLWDKFSGTYVVDDPDNAWNL